MRLFFFLLQRICTLKNANPGMKLSTKSHLKRLFLTEGAELMIRPFINMRAAILAISYQPSVAHTMLSVGVQPGNEERSTETKKRGRCQCCPRKKRTESGSTAATNAASLYVANMA